jgi:hypothetical protein
LLLAASGIEHPGVIYSKQGRRSIGEILSHLELMHVCMKEEEMLNHIEFF